MDKQISNQQEFNDDLKKLSDLYEEGKDLAIKLLPITATDQDVNVWSDLNKVLHEMRALAAIQLQRNHFIDEN